MDDMTQMRSREATVGLRASGQRLRSGAAQLGASGVYTDEFLLRRWRRRRRTRWGLDVDDILAKVKCKEREKHGWRDGRYKLGSDDSMERRKVYDYVNRDSYVLVLFPRYMFIDLR